MFCELKVELQGIEPPIWRVIRVSSRTSLLKFHSILQRAMGWNNSHQYLFEVDGERYGEPSADWGFEVRDSLKMTLERIFSDGNTSFLYEYDLGDSWWHEITLLGKVDTEGEGKPRCIAGARACPPEDCGGVMGYYHLLVALSAPDFEDHDTMGEWVGDKFDHDAFDVAAADRALKRLR